MKKTSLLIEIEATREFNLNYLDEIFSDNYQRLEISINPSQMMYKSAGDVPVWIKIIANFSVWEGMITATGATFSALVTTDLYKLSKKILQAKINGDPKAKVLLSIPYPDERNSCILEITSGTENEIAEQIQKFGRFSLILQDRLKELDIENRDLATPIMVKFLDKQALEINWAEFPELQRFKKIIKIEAV